MFNEQDDMDGAAPSLNTPFFPDMSFYAAMQHCKHNQGKCVMNEVYRPVKIEFPSGDVSQWFEQWNSMFTATGSQVGLINVNFGRSSAPQVEQAVLDEVGSYGKQLGRMGDVLMVLLKHFKPDQELSEDERHAIEDLSVMLREIAAVKERHDRTPLRI
jgi:hypothetical protein